MDYEIGKKLGKYGLPLSSALFVGALALTVYYSQLVKGLGFTEMFKGGDKLAQAYAIMTCVLIGLVVLSAIAYAVKKDEIKVDKNRNVTNIPNATYGLSVFGTALGAASVFVYAMVAKFQQGQDFADIFKQNKIMLGLLTAAIAMVAVAIVSQLLRYEMNDKKLNNISPCAALSECTNQAQVNEIHEV